MIRLQAEFWKFWFCLRQGRRYHFIGLEPTADTEGAYGTKA